MFFTGCFRPMAEVGYPPSIKKDAVPHRSGYRLSCQRNDAVVSRRRGDGTQDLQNRMFCEAWPVENSQPLANQMRRSDAVRRSRMCAVGAARDRANFLRGRAAGGCTED